MTLLRPIEPADHAFVLRLNADDVELLAPMDQTRLDQLLGWSSIAAIIEHDGDPAGFVLVMPADVDYDSEKFRWHAERFGPDFTYLDRVVIAPHARRLGLGRRAYDEIEQRVAATGSPRLALEVNLEPPNEPSLAFHAGRDYAEVGVVGEPGRLVVMLAKEVSPTEGR